jgi:hypothetical protein
MSIKRFGPALIFRVISGGSHSRLPVGDAFIIIHSVSGHLFASDSGWRSIVAKIKATF